jgi:GDP-L-fucose synthase
MKILITGGTGLVGYSIQKLVNNEIRTQLTEDQNTQYIFWNSASCNLLNYDELYGKLKEMSPDIIVHLAANVGGLFKNMNQNVRMFEDNLIMNLNMVSIAKKIGVKLVLSCLSTCIFPDKVEYPITEGQLHNGPPHFSNNGYAYAKRILDIYTQLINIERNVNDTLFVNFVPTNIYGENDNYNLQDAHVMPALIHRAYLASRDNSAFEIRGSGAPLRMFIHSDDFARIICDFIHFYREDGLEKMRKLIAPSRENQENYDFIIADTHENEISICDISIKIAEAFNISNDKIQFLTEYADGQYRKPVSNERLQKLYSLYEKELTFADFDEKIKETCEYFRENYESIRK